MKRTKKLTRKQTIEQNRQRAQQPKVASKLAKSKQMFSLMSYLKRKAENKLALAQFREGKRAQNLEGKPEHVHTEECGHEHETVEIDPDPVIEMAKEAEKEVENAL